MFAHIFNDSKMCQKGKLTSQKKIFFKKDSMKENVEEKGQESTKKNEINTADINYKEYDQIHSLCMRVIVYFVSKYVIVYDIKT